ncbi:PDZ domain-containing protein [Persephonella sp.]
MVKLGISIVPTVSGLILAVVAGFSLAVVLNSYLEYRFFRPPPENIKKLNMKNTSEKKDYRYLSYILEETTADKGSVPSEKEATPPAYQTVEGIKLIGTVIVKGKPYALLSTGSETKAVSVGDKVAGYTVKKIEKYQVTVERNGRTYLITVKLDSKTGSSAGLSGKIPASVKTEGDRQVIKLDKRFVEEKTADIGKLMKDILIQPVVRNGETVGFIFRYVKPNSLLYNLGLRSGDMIVSVNGRSIKTVEEAFKIYNILRNESTVEVVIKRKGREKTLIFQIQ